MSGRADRGWGLAAVVAVVMAAQLVPHVVAQYEPNAWLLGPSACYVDIQDAILMHGTLDQRGIQPASAYSGDHDLDQAWSNAALGSDGQWWPKYSYLISVASLPFRWLFGTSGSLIFNLTMLILIVVAAYLLARAFVPARYALPAAILVGLTGPFARYSYSFLNDGFHAALMVAGLAAAAHRRAALGGALWGFGVWAHTAGVFSGPALLAIALDRAEDRRRTFVRLAVGGGMVLAALGAANTAMFGAPWVTGYQRVLTVQAGALVVDTHTGLFTGTLTGGLWRMLTTPSTGLLTMAPIVVVGALAGLKRLDSTHRITAIGTTVTLLALVLFYAAYQYYDVRFLLAWFGLATLPVAAALEWTWTSWTRQATPDPATTEPDAAPEPGAGTEPGPSSRRWAGWGPKIGLGVLALAVGWRLAGPGDAPGDDLTSHVRGATVTEAERVCDWYDHRRRSWSCARAEAPREAGRVGADRTEKRLVGGQPVEDGLVFAGARGGLAIEIPSAPLRGHLVLRLATPDDSPAPAGASLTVAIDGETVWTGPIPERGVRTAPTNLKTAPGAATVRIELTPGPSAAPVAIVEATIRD